MPRVTVDRVAREAREARRAGAKSHAASPDARRTILDACQALVVESGYERLSIRRLTERCGYTAPTIYLHFGDKRGLTDAMLEDRFRDLVTKLRRVRRSPDPVRTVRSLLRAFIQFGLENPSHYQLLAIRKPDDTAPVRSLEEAETLLEAPLRELAAAGLLVHEDVEAIIQSLWALGHGLITLVTSRPDLDWSRNLVQVALDAILHGAIRGAPAPQQESSS